MNTVEFLEKELASYEDSFHKAALNFNNVVLELITGCGMGEHEARIETEAVKRALKNRRDFLRELIKKAKEEEAR